MARIRGRKIDLLQRQIIITMLDDCCTSGARLAKACEVIGLSPRTVQRWRQNGAVKPDGRKAAANNRTPANKLTVKGIYFYLYMIMDLFSRKIVGWEVFDEQTAEHASTVAHKAYLREGIAGKLLRLHSDNGSPMKGATMLATLQRLGVAPSFSRPSVSNDNPYFEALFKTLKYHRSFPE